MRVGTSRQRYGGFTIVELLIVIVVIAILAAITIVAFNGIQQRAAAGILQGDLRNAATALEVLKTDSGNEQYPADTDGLTASEGTTFEYTSGGDSYCLSATSEREGVPGYSISSSNPTVTEGVCVGHDGGGGGSIADGSLIQTITSANCPTDRIRAVDARDNHTYWVQELADGKCWMLTNLGYAGGGTNTYGDARTLTDGTGGSGTYTTASYYIVPSTTNYTTEPTEPSISTDGTGQYGYLYNWCGAMGGQATAACANASSPALNLDVSACPAGWRLPTGNGGELGALNTAVNAGSSSSDAGLRTVWLAQRGSYWQPGYGFSQQGTYSEYWSSTANSGSNAYLMEFASSTVNTTVHYGKEHGFAVRCVAS